MLKISLVAALLASAVPEEEPSYTDADEAARVGRSGGVTVYNFDDDSIEGEVLSPEGANIHSRGRIKHASLLDIRPHFIRELIRLALDL